MPARLFLQQGRVPQWMHGKDLTIEQAREILKPAETLEPEIKRTVETITDPVKIEQLSQGIIPTPEEPQQVEAKVDLDVIVEPQPVEEVKAAPTEVHGDVVEAEPELHELKESVEEDKV
jgi:hypothetical protein